MTFSRTEDQVVYVPGTPKRPTHKAHAAITKKIGLAPLVVLIFYSVSGGPFGIEDIVRAGGPFYALAGFSLLLVWAIPEALITAELSTAMPEASGSVAWVERAFGPFWAFQKGEVAGCGAVRAYVNSEDSTRTRRANRATEQRKGGGCSGMDGRGYGVLY